MAGNYHFTGDPNLKFANATDSHFSGNFTDPTGAVTGCTGGNYPSQSINVRELQTGGQGYGMANQQPIAGFNRMPDYTSYEEIGVKDPSNLGTSTQYNPSMALPVIKGGRGRYKRGGSNLNYYGFNDKNGENLSTFAGSGYPPISIGSQNLTGGRRIRRRKGTRSHKHLRRRRGHKSHKLSKHRRHSRRHKTRRHRLGMKKTMSSKLFKNLIGGRKRVYKGGYSQFLGDQAFSQGYELGGPITPSTSALANPIPIKPYNNCSDPFGPK
jgi:hypothetical protein